MHRASYFDVYISRPTSCTNSYNVSLFIINAVHVSDFLVHHQERRLLKLYRNWYKPVPYIWLLCGAQQPDVWYRLIPIAIQLQTTSLLMMD